MVTALAMNQRWLQWLAANKQVFLFLSPGLAWHSVALLGCSCQFQTLGILRVHRSLVISGSGEEMLLVSRRWRGPQPEVGPSLPRISANLGEGLG